MNFSIAKAFIAKSIYNFETTDILIEYLHGCKNLRRLCGWEYSKSVPSRATFSRAFSEFADGNLGQVIHEAMVTEHIGEKIAGHVSRDSTAIQAREKPVKTEKRCNDRPKRSLDENLKDLPTYCNVGTKKNSKGYKESWTGYKLHLDCIDG